MAEQKHKLITCRALAPMLGPLVGPGVQVVELEIGLHLSPERLRGELMSQIASLEEPGATILLGYGLCGRALEGVSSSVSQLVLPRVDDCVGALLGSRQRHRDLLLRRAGSYFLTPQWLDTEMNIFEQLARQATRVPPERREGLVKMALKHYDTLAFVHGPICSPQDMARGAAAGPGKRPGICGAPGRPGPFAAFGARSLVPQGVCPAPARAGHNLFLGR